MSELTSCPAGVLERIVSMLDEDTLKTLRLTYKKLSGFANRILFRSISLYDGPDSCRCLQSILIQPYLQEEVLNLTLNIVEDHYRSLPTNAMHERRIIIPASGGLSY